MSTPTAAPGEAGLAFSSARGRWVLAATVLGSGIAFLDSTVVNVALPHIGEDLDTGVGGLQWVLNGYLLAVSALILLGGSLGDRFGRKRIFQLGIVVFAIGSLLCAVAPTAVFLVLARVVQGVGGALLTPGQPGHPRGQLPPRRPFARHRGVVGAQRRGVGDRPVPRRLAGRRRLVAVDLPHQPAAGRLRPGGGGPARARVARPRGRPATSTGSAPR